MLIVLPPSETKSLGGNGSPLDFSRLSFPELQVPRTEIAQELVDLCSSEDQDHAAEVLGLSEKLRPEIDLNRELFTSPTTPALFRYTGVLYDALSAATLTDRAQSRLAIGSALFGVVGASDLIPHYRLSGSNKLAGRTLKSFWGTAITEALAQRAQEDLIIDLRSGTYQQLGPYKDAITVRVESVQEDGSRKVISHFNKHYKGLLARELARSRAEAHDIQKVKSIAEKAGFTMEFSATKAQELVMVIN